MEEGKTKKETAIKKKTVNFREREKETVG